MPARCDDGRPYLYCDGAVPQIDFMPFDPTVKRTEGTIRLPSGETFKTTKGAPHIILALCKDEAVTQVTYRTIKEM